MLRRRYIKPIVLSLFSHGRDLVGPVLEQDHQAILAQKKTLRPVLRTLSRQLCLFSVTGPYRFQKATKNVRGKKKIVVGILVIFEVLIGHLKQNLIPHWQ
jgi:hypothetical protein